MAVLQVNDDEFNDHLANNEQVVVKFFADWCGTCRLFSPKFKRLSDDERYKNVVFLDINAEQNPEARKSAKVNNLPYFAAFKNGELLDSSATSREDRVIAMLDKLTGAETELRQEEEQ